MVLGDGLHDRGDLLARGVEDRDRHVDDAWVHNAVGVPVAPVTDLSLARR
nr:hypothetical protein [Kibdelosporangium sp. MJ126-NF4]